MQDPTPALRTLFDRAVEVADPMRSLAACLPPRPAGRVLVIGAGKASARMAEAVEAAWGPCDGLVITRYGYARPCRRIEIVEAAHPVPDAAGAAATARMLEVLQGLGTGDFVLALMSGGASALLVAPADGISLADKQALNAALLASGAPINRMNTVRKHISRVKGGQLAAAAYPARMLCLMISDVPGDDPANIGSGPTVGDATTPADARAVLADWHIDVPASVTTALTRPTGVIALDDPRLSLVENRIYAAPAQSLAAAAELARGYGWQVRPLGDALEGEARDVAADHAAMARAVQDAMAPGDAPVLLLSGGELTVTRRGVGTGGPHTTSGTGGPHTTSGIGGPHTTSGIGGPNGTSGIGGPNAEYALALAIALNGAPGVHAIACDTDGVDGAAEVAGATIGPGTLAQARARGVDARTSLAANDAHSFFASIGAQVITGPTLTNVNDFRAILVSRPDSPDSPDSKG